MAITAKVVPRKYRTAGLSALELAVAQEQAEAVFPDDLCELLATTLPAGDGFPDWRGQPGKAMQEWRERLVGTIHFDVLHNSFWLDEWGALPDDASESRQIVTEALREAPALIPIYAHRAIPNDPVAAGNPVFSVYQTDIILYGANLTEYLANEFKTPAQPLARFADDQVLVAPRRPEQRLALQLVGTISL